MLDRYCERVAAGLLAEPLNALTNAAFLVAAFAAGAVLRRHACAFTRCWELWLLVALVAAIGAGSTLWHTLATPRALLADVVPIMLFVNVCMISFLVRVVAMPAWGVLPVLGAYQVLDQLVQRYASPEVLNGSLFYLPAWLVLAAAAAWVAARSDIIAPRMSLALALFTVSLLARTLDRALCPAVPIGTHFLWHLLNAGVLYLLITALAAHLPRGARDGGLQG